MKGGSRGLANVGVCECAMRVLVGYSFNEEVSPLREILLGVR